MNELHLFAGAGGGILAGQLLGHRTVCAVECDPYAQAILVARQNDGTFLPFPIWDDVRTFDGGPWREIVDVMAGGFPCQDISVAGKGAGLDGKRSGLWGEMARIIGEIRPRYAFIENSPALVNQGLDRVLADLASLGFDAVWGIMGAADVGAPHRRDRIWILAHTRNHDCRKQPDILLQRGRSEEAKQTGLGGFGGSETKGFKHWPTDPAGMPESGMDRMVDGVAHWSHRIKAIGNGQVPRVAAAAFRILLTRLEALHSLKKKEMDHG